MVVVVVVVGERGRAVGRGWSFDMSEQGATMRGDDELKAVIRAKNEAWRALAEADRRCLAYQRTNYTADGYDPLPEGWEARRADLADRYMGARQRYLRAILGRRNGR